MKLFPAKNKCGCDADITAETAVMAKDVFTPEGKYVGKMRDKQIHHYRERDEARFWHWATTEVVKI